MYRPTDPQKPLFHAGGLLPREKQARCEESWAGPFRAHALPILRRHEAEFADLFHPDNGRPNRPVPLVLGTLILKEIRDFTDQEVLDALEFDTRWWYAFEREPSELHLCQKTLHNFRTRLIEHGKASLVFRTVTDELIRVLGIDTSRQRLDSKHVLSNMARLSRLGLFCETLRVFLAALKKAVPEVYARVGSGIRKRYGEESWYADARKDDAPRRLGVAARDTYRLYKQVRKDEAVAKLPELGLLKRLLEEQCEMTTEPQEPKGDEDDRGDGAVPVKLREPKEVGSDSMQSPHDPDATYSGHKGKGYAAQIAETCGNETKKNPVEMITAVKLTPACESDKQATVPMLDELQERKIPPKELVADTAFGGGENAAEASKRGTNVLCPAPGPSKPEQGVPYPAPEPKCPTEAKEATRWLTRQEAQPEFQKRYAIRAGIEATNSELNRAHGAKKLRVRGEPRVRLALFLKAVACNVKRALRYWAGQIRKVVRGIRPRGAPIEPSGATAVEAGAAR